jgi:hypothetical protein
MLAPTKPRASPGGVASGIPSESSGSPFERRIDSSQRPSPPGRRAGASVFAPGWHAPPSQWQRRDLNTRAIMEECKHPAAFGPPAGSSVLPSLAPRQVANASKPQQRSRSAGQPDTNASQCAPCPAQLRAESERIPQRPSRASIAGPVPRLAPRILASLSYWIWKGETATWSESAVGICFWRKLRGDRSVAWAPTRGRPPRQPTPVSPVLPYGAPQEVARYLVQ